MEKKEYMIVLTHGTLDEQRRKRRGLEEDSSYLSVEISSFLLHTGPHGEEQMDLPSVARAAMTEAEAKIIRELHYVEKVFEMREY